MDEREIMKLSTLLHKIREFYTVARNKWGAGALRTDDGAYCLLGAAAAVVTNKEAIDTLTWADISDDESGYVDDIGDVLATFSHYNEIPNVKGAPILRKFEAFFEEHTEGERTVDGWNDYSKRTRAEVLAHLRYLEKIALEAGV